MKLSKTQSVPNPKQRPGRQAFSKKFSNSFYVPEADKDEEFVQYIPEDEKQNQNESKLLSKLSGKIKNLRNRSTSKLSGNSSKDVQKTSKSKEPLVSPSSNGSQKTVNSPQNGKRGSLGGSSMGSPAMNRSRRHAGSVYKRSKILKDLDWLSDDQSIYLGNRRADMMKGQLERDLTFLRELCVMDYSLLVGICKKRTIDYEEGDDEKEAKDEKWQSYKLFSFAKGGMCWVTPPTSRPSAILGDVLAPATPCGDGDASPGVASGGSSSGELEAGSTDHLKPSSAQIKNDSSQSASSFDPYGADLDAESMERMREYVYFVGIIDFLQKYNSKKRIERFWKGLKEDESKISSVDPVLYSERMKSFLECHII